MSRRIVLSVVLPMVFVGCGIAPEAVSKDDERLKPLWAAMDHVDRASLGFSLISPDDEIRLEGKQMRGDDYDAMLHIYGKTSRTIAFRKVGSEYKWIGEQEIYEGPREYKSVDGTLKEQISITYETQHVSGAPLNTVYVQYLGDDPRLKHRNDLTLMEVTPILQEWSRPR